MKQYSGKKIRKWNELSTAQQAVLKVIVDWVDAAIDLGVTPAEIQDVVNELLNEEVKVEPDA